jgi:hypothetical protein
VSSGVKGWSEPHQQCPTHCTHATKSIAGRLTRITHQHAADDGLPVSRGHGPEASVLVEADTVAVHLQRRGHQGFTQTTTQATHLHELT